MTQRVPGRYVSRAGARVLLLMMILGAANAACGRKEANEPPVATPSLTLSRARVAIGSPVNATYRFQVAQDAKFDRDYWVFVHVLDPHGEQMWTEDHLPP